MSVDALVTHIRGTLGDAGTWRDPGGYPGSLALCVLDSVYSIGVRYGGTQNVVRRYRDARRAEGADPDRDSAKDLLQFCDRCGGWESLMAVLGNQQLTSTRGGIRKALAVSLGTRALLDHEINTTADLRALDARSGAAEVAWRRVPGQRSGISWRYLLMLAGAGGVKPDRMVIRFVQTATERAFSADDAATLVETAAALLGVKPMTLDHAIWRFQSGRAS